MPLIVRCDYVEYNLMSLSQEERDKLIDAASNGDVDLLERLASKGIDVNCSTIELKVSTKC